MNDDVDRLRALRKLLLEIGIQSRAVCGGRGRCRQPDVADQRTELWPSPDKWKSYQPSNAPVITIAVVATSGSRAALWFLGCPTPIS